MWFVQFLSTLGKHLTQWIIQFRVIRWMLAVYMVNWKTGFKVTSLIETICCSKWEKIWPSNSALWCPTGIPLGTKAIFDLRRWLAWLYIKWWIHLYTDDTTAFVIGKNEDEVVTLLNIIFSEISKWCSINSLKIHPTKCKVMLISRKSFTGPLKPVKWGNKCLEYTDKVKVLGIYIDNKLTWKIHIKEVT